MAISGRTASAARLSTSRCGTIPVPVVVPPAYGRVTRSVVKRRGDLMLARADVSSASCTLAA